MYKISFFFLLLYNSVFSQNMSDAYSSALNCFLNEDYISARIHFSNLIESEDFSSNSLCESASYYYYLSSLRQYHPDTEELFNEFMLNYPFSIKRNDAIFFMSQYLFERKKYKDVINLLSQINLYQLEGEKKELSFFYLGYSAYVKGQNDLAKSSFYELITSFSSSFRDDAIFYNSNILLREGDNSGALSGFQGLQNSKKYAKEVPYFISKILFDINEYQNLSNYLEPILDSSSCNNYNNLVLLQAKSLYHLEDYDPAVVYFEEYKSLVDTLNKEQLYQIGFSYHKKGLYGFAINHLNKIILSDQDSITQYAFYYLADSYRETGNKLEAMNAFRSASLLEMDSIISHDAFYQFAVLSYEQVNPLYNSINYLSEFIDKYPNSEHVDQIYTCLANTYLNTQNYDEAINVLEKSNFLDSNIKEQYQKICFYRGVQLYNDAMYKDAIIYFNKGISVNNISSLLYESYYWKGEANFKLNNFSEALLAYDKLEKNSLLYLKSLYAQGYCYLKQNDYNNSITKFKYAAENIKDIKLLHDIYTRIGDNYFLLNNYDLSAQFFDKALTVSGFQDDYCAYKRSTSYVLLEDYDRAIESFQNLINQLPNSNYLDDAIFDLGNIYILTKNFDFAINSFLRITVDFPNSIFFSLSKLKLGLVYYMKQEDDRAIFVLKELLNKFSNTHISEQALSIIKNIYNETGKANEFLELIKNVDHDYSKSELDSSTYYAAELQYVQSNYEIAISSLNSYLSYYPNGLFFLESHYFLYKSYENLGDLDNAINALNKIVNDKENKYTIEGLASLARMSYKLEKYISAETYFYKLLHVASTIDLKQEAILGLLESKFQLYKYNDVINQISSLVEEDFFSGQDNLRIHYLHAYSLYKMNKNLKSLNEFEWLVNNSDGALKAESIFYKALISYNMRNYNDSQSSIFGLINELPGYEKWVDKGLLLLAKNYIMQKDMFQAQHVLIELEKKSNDPILLNQIETILIDNPELKTDSIAIKK